MSNTYQIYLISDSTGETLDRIFLATKAQFKNIDYKVHSYSFTRTENQILKILEEAKKKQILLYFIQLLTTTLQNIWQTRATIKKYLVLEFLEI